jgi:RNA polymerase sigma factor for flagellar operon FliA
MAKTKTKLTWNEREARDALGRYEGMVRALAHRMRPAASLGQALDEEDLCAEGRVAVLEALRTYKGYGIEEKTWVRTRIRQRMIDAVRRLDLRSRDETRLAAKYNAGEAEPGAEAERGRRAAARRLLSLDVPAGEEGDLRRNRLRDSLAPRADEHTERSAQYARLMAALGRLPERQRQAIELGLFEGLALREIGDMMGISESRVCQLQKRAVEHLRTAVAADEQPAAA